VPAPVSLDSRVAVPEDVLFRELDGEAVILNLSTGTYYGLDQTGTRMWALLAEHGTLRAAYDILLAEYEVCEAQLAEDLLALVDKLVSHGLLRYDET